MTRIRRILSSRKDSGSASLETVILAPVLILMINFAVTAGRIQIAKEAVRQAVQVAVRAGTQARNSNDAYANASAVGVALALQPGIHCEGGSRSMGDNPAVWISGAQPNIGATSYYVIFTTCTIPAIFLPLASIGTVSFTVTAYSPLDPYRCRGGVPC